jgi:hypothetical protein
LFSLKRANRRTQLTLAQRRIVEYCAKGPGKYVVPHPSLPDSWAFAKRKESRDPSVEDEARTQAYIYKQAQSNASAPCVPEVYDVFYDGPGSTYLVMEHIAASTFRGWIDGPGLSDEERDSRTATAVAKIADTVALLLQCPLPPGERIGPVGGGCIQHGFFCMEEAPIPFANSVALEKYVNKVRFHVVPQPRTV